MVYSAKSDDTNTISQFTRKKDITITTGGTSTPVNYQVRLTIAYESEMQADFDDIRFNTKSGGYIDYWIESKTDSVTATVWVELPDAIIDPGSDVICMYHGNAGLGNAGDIDDTFVTGDDFASLSGWAGDTGSYSISNGQLVRGASSNDKLISKTISLGSGTPLRVKSRIKNLGTANWHEIGVKICDANTPSSDIRKLSNGVLMGTQYYGTRLKFMQKSVSGSETVLYENGAQDNAYHNHELRFNGTTWYYDFGQSNVYSNASIANFTETYLLIGSFSDTADKMYVDWVFVGKYITNEPTVTYGTSQHQRRTPQFIN